MYSAVHSVFVGCVSSACGMACTACVSDACVVHGM